MQLEVLHFSHWGTTMVKQNVLYLHANYLCLEQDFDSTEKFSVQKDRVSHMLPETFQDRIIRVYTKKKELVCWKDFVWVLDDTEAPINDLMLMWVVFLSCQFCTLVLAYEHSTHESPLLSVLCMSWVWIYYVRGMVCRWRLLQKHSRSFKESSLDSQPRFMERLTAKNGKSKITHFCEPSEILELCSYHFVSPWNGYNHYDS